MSETLDQAAVLPVLTTTWLGRPYHYVAEIGSTNDELKAWISAGSVANPPAGTILLTDYQSAGRGRLDRRWEAPPGTALLFSVLFRPGWPVTRAGWLAMLAGVAVAEAIEQTTGATAGLKWPNDIMLQQAGQWQKAGGLLLDSQVEGDRLAHAILGIGLNVTMPPEALPSAATPPTSLSIVTGAPVSRLALLAACLQRLEVHYEAADRGQSPHDVWQARLITLGQPVVVFQGAGTQITGMAEATDEAGSLLVRDAAGLLHTVAAGDVTLRPRPSDMREEM